MMKTTIFTSILNKITVVLCLLWFGYGCGYGCGFSQTNKKIINEKQDTIPIYNGVYVYADIVGPIQRAFSGYGQIEGGVQVNIKQRFFPAIEVGLGMANYEDKETETHYKTSAPYFKVGCDYSVLKNKTSPYKLLVGARYGVTNFNYSFENKSVTEPINQTSSAIGAENLNTTFHWFEALVGVNVEVYKMFHLGWTVRYKHKITQKTNNDVAPYYIPGFGTAEKSGFGATFNIIIAI